MSPQYKCLDTGSDKSTDHPHLELIMLVIKLKLLSSIKIYISYSYRLHCKLSTDAQCFVRIEGRERRIFLSNCGLPIITIQHIELL